MLAFNLLMHSDDMCVDNASYKVQLDSINEVWHFSQIDVVVIIILLATS